MPFFEHENDDRERQEERQVETPFGDVLCPAPHSRYGGARNSWVNIRP